MAKFTVIHNPSNELVSLENVAYPSLSEPQVIVQERIVEKQVPVEVIKEVQKIVEVPVEVIKEVKMEVPTEKITEVIPTWIFVVGVVQTALIALLLLTK